LHFGGFGLKSPLGGNSRRFINHSPANQGQFAGLYTEYPSAEDEAMGKKGSLPGPTTQTNPTGLKDLTGLRDIARRDSIHDQRTNGVIFQFLAPGEKAQFDEKRDLQDTRAELLDERGGGSGGPA